MVLSHARKIPGVATLLAWRQRAMFHGSARYWESRYASGGDSGGGSYGVFAQYKADVLNAFVAEHDIASVIEFGCGDGAQLSLAKYPRYIGFDVSQTIIDRCRARFADNPNYQFLCVSDDDGSLSADLALSLDVLFHLVEQEVFERYLNRLFDAGERYVIIYSSNFDLVPPTPHIRHREFLPWVAKSRPDFTLLEHIRSPYKADVNAGGDANDCEFYVFQRLAD